MANNAERIARALKDRRYIKSEHFDAWHRAQQGETGKEIAALYRKGTQTIYDWIHKVHDMIRDQKIIEQREDLEEGRPLSGHTSASGSRCRRVGNPTEQSRMVIDQSSWDEERLKLEGKLDRWSRKR